MATHATPAPGTPAPAVRARRLRTRSEQGFDVAAIVMSLFFGAMLFIGDVGRTDERVALLDILPGLVAIATLWWRRVHPLAVALLAGVIASVSVTASGAAIVAVYTAGAYCRAPAAIAVVAVHSVTAYVFFAHRPSSLLDSPDQYSPLWVPLTFVTLMNIALVAWGMFVRSRRELVHSLRERAERAEAEQRLRAEQARTAERTRIAREMHDVVAHRVSLVALHAGALQMRPDLSADEVARTAELIRTTARTALDELRGVVGVLRDPDGTIAPAAPQPTLADLSRLVDESRRAGARVELALEVTEPDAAAGTLGRDVYRIVQEALTNVHKHAPRTSASVRVTGGPGRGLQVVVRNPLPVAVGLGDLTGARAGLLGLTERVTLSGGTLRHGPTPAGDFEIAADLHWPANGEVPRSDRRRPEAQRSDVRRTDGA